jgi:hypothetical protein
MTNPSLTPDDLRSLASVVARALAAKDPHAWLAAVANVSTPWRAEQREFAKTYSQVQIGVMLDKLGVPQDAKLRQAITLMAPGYVKLGLSPERALAAAAKDLETQSKRPKSMNESAGRAAARLGLVGRKS